PARSAARRYHARHRPPASPARLRHRRSPRRRSVHPVSDPFHPLKAAWRTLLASAVSRWTNVNETIVSRKDFCSPAHFGGTGEQISPTATLVQWPPAGWQGGIGNVASAGLFGRF